MKIEIDQSGKIEDTSKDTVLAFSNSISYSIKIPAKVKRQLQRYFREEGEIRLFIYKAFAAGLFLLINPFESLIGKVIIDTEYPGHEDLILELLGKLFKEVGLSLEKLNIRFAFVGKDSPSDKLAHQVATRKLKAYKRVTFEEILSLIRQLEIKKPSPT